MIAKLSVGLLILDQLAKYVIRASMGFGESVPIIRNSFHITLVQNTGAIFGMFRGQNMVFVWLSVMAIGLLLYEWERFPKGRVCQFLLVLIVTGLVSNLIDRVLFGFVTDFLDFRVWPVFNFADAMVSVGVAGLVVKCLK
ncbi:MAG: signal peptidase II [Candidatus Woesearchaeota archaeon]